jgi:WD40 repeat protein
MHWQDHTIVFAQAGREILAVADTGGAPEVWVTAGPQEMVSSPFLLPGGDVLLYSRAKADASWDKADIMVWSRKAGPPKVLLSGGSSARWVPTGHIVYALDGNLLAAPFDIQKLQAGSPVPVVEGTASSGSLSNGPSNFDFSQSGTLIYVPALPGILSQEGLRMLVLADRAGKITSLPNVRPGAYAYPRVSSDGKWAAVEMLNDASIQILDLFGRNQPRRLTLEGNNSSPIWSPDGRRIAYRSSRDGKIGVMVQNADGSGTADWLATSTSRLYTYPFSWFQEKVVFAAGEDGDPGLSTVTVSGEKKIEVFENAPRIQMNASFSPDGSWIAYQSFEAAGASQIFVRQFPKGDKHQITSGKGSYSAPVWSPHGNELFFYSVEAQRLMSVRIQTQPSFSVVGEPAAIPIERTFQQGSSLRTFDIMPDGKNLLLLQPADAGSRSTQEVRVILNWFEELKERVVQ